MHGVANAAPHQKEKCQNEKDNIRARRAFLPCCAALRLQQGTESSTAAESTSIPVPEPESSAPESIEPKPESSDPEPAVLVGEIIPAVAETTVSHGSETAFTAQVLPENAADKTLLWESDDESVATVDKSGVVTAVSQGKCRITVRSADGGAVSDIALTVGAPGLTYIQGILVVNKTYSLPADYDPGVDPEAKAALDKMFDDAAKEGIKLWVASGYRSYSHQNSLYNNYVARDGVAPRRTDIPRAPGIPSTKRGLPLM